MSQDPIGFAGGSANPYVYALDSPAIFVDPTGQLPGFLERFAEIAGLLALVTGIVVGAAPLLGFGVPVIFGEVLPYLVWTEVLSYFFAGGANIASGNVNQGVYE